MRHLQTVSFSSFGLPDEGGEDALYDNQAILRLRNRECLPVVAGILEAEDVVNAGFGLKSDQGLLHAGLESRSGLCLTSTRCFGRTAIAVFPVCDLR